MPTRPHRWPILALLVLLAGCGATQPSTMRRHTPAAPVAHQAVTNPPTPSQVALLRSRYPGWLTDFTKHVVPFSEFQDGGPPRDGIPPIDHPQAVSLKAGDRFLSGREPVIAVRVGDQVRAYPEQVLVWHEIVNDVLGGRPIAVTYCPLCNSAIAFDRVVGRTALTFGTTGKLRDSDLVMWDRQTQSWWQQFTGTALAGAYTGNVLRPIDTQVLSWAQFETAYPYATVLSRPAGFDRPYGQNPYVGYDTVTSSQPTFYRGHLDPRLPPSRSPSAATRARRGRIRRGPSGRGALLNPGPQARHNRICRRAAAGGPLHPRGRLGARRHHHLPLARRRNRRGV